MPDGRNPAIEMWSQSPAFRRSVALRMEAYKQRMADRIKRELDERAEGPRDLAYAIQVSDRTVERWLDAETEPRRGNWRAMAEHFGKDVKDLRPDLAAEERQLRDQLDRMERKLDQLVKQRVDLGPPADGLPRAAQDAQPSAKAPGRSKTRSAGSRRKQT